MPEVPRTHQCWLLLCQHCSCQCDKSACLPVQTSEAKESLFTSPSIQCCAVLGGWYGSLHSHRPAEAICPPAQQQHPAKLVTHQHVGAQTGRVGGTVKDLSTQLASNKVKRLRTSEAHALEGATCCVKLPHTQFEELCRVRSAILEPLVRALRAVEASVEAAPEAAALHKALLACSCVLRPQHAEQVLLTHQCLLMWGSYGALGEKNGR